ncbi:unnamed protein product [Knipowitschia caucasica]
MMKSLSPLLLFLLLLLCCGGLLSCPSVCSCHNRTVDCSGRSLSSSTLPDTFPVDTTELRLHNNLLTTLPRGLLQALDALKELRSVTLHGNPWSCDCGALELRAWLLRHFYRSRDKTEIQRVQCSSPVGLRGRIVAYLSEQELLDSCHYWFCDLALAAQLCLLCFVLIQGALLITVVVFLRRFQLMSKEARRTQEESFTAGDRPLDDEYTPLRDTSL